jgi:predicted nucleic acid-binding protein
VSDAVVDTSALIFLSKLNRTNLLNRFGKVIVPRAVWEELAAGESKDPSSTQLIRGLIDAGGATVLDVQAPVAFLPHLGKGERAAIWAASQVRGTTLIVDDRKARLAARLLRLQTVSVPGLLLLALYDGKIEYARFESDIYRLAEFGYHLSPRLFNDFLVAARKRAKPR